MKRTIRHLGRFALVLFVAAAALAASPVKPLELGKAAPDLVLTDQHVYPDANHNSWDRAYADEALWNWLFAQRRSGRPPS